MKTWKKEETWDTKKIKRAVHDGAQQIWKVLFPPHCIVCDGLVEQEDVCLHACCKKKLSFVKEPVCVHCGRPVTAERFEFCYDCQKRADREVTFRQGKALFLYVGEIKNTMYRFKYQNRREYAAFFAEYASQTYETWIRTCGINLIVPVPMYRRKERARGYNQAAVFARELAVRLNLPVNTHLVERIRDTTPQKELSDLERKNNLKNAFQITENIVQYRCILLVDDIYTTGSTVDAVTETLYLAGAEEVYVMTICMGKGF